MTMQQIHSPKPKVFGEGYGAHLAYNFSLIKLFFKLSLQIFVNAFVPGLYYEQAHWKVIELYHKMRGIRHGTISDHRCKECGGELYSIDEVHCRRNELKDIERERDRTELCDRALAEMDLEDEYVPARMSDEEKEEILELMDAITPEEVEAELEESSDK